ncbi:peptide/nickel transport system permease protein [Aminobacter niigataensis]|uniref:Peptide/nickel transport system permease protein n=1 Tax=Aminobacter niigataensis TaxID=83265 RepID=A0ABR6L1E3_9HYPH|nr:ABC transporter permease [Aminobacter niigataensis]MBB4650614.1 peptide/nickel transport system permease protein [Aminobacter niigataensis]
MTAVSDTSAATRSPRKKSRLAKTLSLMRKKPLGAIGGVIILVFCLVALFAPWLAPFDPLKIDSSNLLTPPNASNWFGTDEFGRDILSRLIWGARISLFVGLSAVLLGTTTGSVLGLISGYFGGKLDSLIQRVMDTLMAFPMLVLALAMVAALGSSVRNVIIALAVVIMPNAARVIRSSALTVREKPFVEAAHNLGLSTWRILFRHVLPNCVAPFIILATAGLGSAILSEASLSFLGLGTPPPEPSWGAMLSGKTQRYMTEAPWLAIFPGLAITLVVFGFNFLGDALRDILDPKLRSR